MECITSKKRSKNLFKTALNKLVGKHVDNVYKVTVLKTFPSITAIKKINQVREKNIDDESPKVPPRRKSRPSSQNSIKGFGIIYSIQKI